MRWKHISYLIVKVLQTLKTCCTVVKTPFLSYGSISSQTGTLTQRCSDYVASFGLVYGTNPTQSLTALADLSPSPFCILSTPPYCLHDGGVVPSDATVIVANLSDHPDPRGFCPTGLRFILFLTLHRKLQGSSFPESNFGFGLQRFLPPQCKTPSPPVPTHLNDMLSV